MRRLWLVLSAILIASSGCTAKKLVLIKSDPTNAMVTIDGIQAGRAPVEQELAFPPEKPTHLVSLSLPGYFEKEISVEYEPKSLTEYSVEMEKLSKKVEITSDPAGATLYIHGKEVGITPYKDTLYFDIEPEYELTARLAQFQDAKLSVRFEPVSQTSYSVRLKELTEMELPLAEWEVRRGRGGVKRVRTTRKARSLKEVIERSPNVKSVSKITNYNDTTITLGGPVISPSGDLVVYSLTTVAEVSAEDVDPMRDTFDKVAKKWKREHSNIWKQRPASASRTRVTFGKYLDDGPVFDPTGNYLYFSSTRNSDNPGLWRIAADGAGGITRISSGQSEDFDPAVSKDLIAFSSIIPGAEDTQIWTVNANGNLFTQLREGESPCLSSDGKKILFVRRDERTGKRQLWFMGVDGGNETLLSADPDVEDFEPQWSPDGAKIIFTSNAGRDSHNVRNRDIWIMNTDGSDRTQLTTNGSEDDKPYWDPDGRYIYFRSTRGFQSNIWRFELSTPST